MSSRIDKENSRTSSIARSINLEFWLRDLSQFIALNLVIIIVVAGAFFMWREGIVPPGQEVESRFFIGSSYKTWQYVIETGGGVQYKYYMHLFLDLCRVPAIVIVSVEGLFLFSALFFTKTIRRKMQPLNKVAIKVEELSNMSASGVDLKRASSGEGTKMSSSGVGSKTPSSGVGTKTSTSGVGTKTSTSGVGSKTSSSGVDLKTMEKAISQLNPQMPDARVTTGDKELESLEIAINNMLERMRESHRQQERFVSDASHELRTPIAVIQGYVNMLDRWGKDDEQVLKESIEALKNESEHMKNLVEQLLFLARGDSGRNVLHPEEINLVDIVRDVLDESIMIDNKHVYQMKDCPEEVRVTGDGAMLKQALRIFVQNAAKYSREGDTITLGAGVQEGRPFYSVQDEGIGMQASEVVHVFERFYRSDSARNSAQGGTGLGLSIAKWIVDAHGGVIEILSRPEFGTRITVRL